MDTGEQLRVVVEGVTLGELKSTEILIAGKFMLQSELSDYISLSIDIDRCHSCANGDALERNVFSFRCTFETS